MRWTSFVLAGIMLLGIGFSEIFVTLQSDPVQVAGDASNPAHYEFKVYATSTEEVEVEVSTAAGWYMSADDQHFTLGRGGVKYVDLFVIIPSSANSDKYPVYVTFKTPEKDYYYRGLYVQREEPQNTQEHVKNQLELKSEYREITVKQGESQTLYFLIRNNGDTPLKNVLISGDVSQRLNPEYPVSGFTVFPHEKKVLPVKITVPKDYPVGYYEITLKAASGDLEDSDSVLLHVVEKYSYQGSVEMTMVSEDKLEEDGKTVGYEIVLKVKNNEVTDLNNVEVHVEGLPEGWEVEGDTVFSLKGSELRTIRIKIRTNDFSKQDVRIALVKDGEEIAAVDTVLAGERIGITGAFYVGGSFLLGILVAGLAVAGAFYYVRQKNIEKEEEEDMKTREYLKQLVEQAKADADTDEKIEKEL